MKTTILAFIGLCAFATSGCFMFNSGASDRAYAKKLQAGLDTVRPIPAWAKQQGSLDASTELHVATRAHATYIQGQGGGPPPVMMRAYPIVNDWEMDRNNVGVITAREARVAVFFKGGRTGVCRFEDATLIEEEQGGSWGKPYIKPGLAYAIECSEIGQLPGAPL